MGIRVSFRGRKNGSRSGRGNGRMSGNLRLLRLCYLRLAGSLGGDDLAVCACPVSLTGLGSWVRQDVGLVVRRALPMREVPGSNPAVSTFFGFFSRRSGRAQP